MTFDQQEKQLSVEERLVNALEKNKELRIELESIHQYNLKREESDKILNKKK